MDINASIIDQQLTGLLEKHSDWLPAGDANKQRSAAFVLLCMANCLDIPQEDAVELLTEGGNDAGVDGLHIGEVEDGEFLVTVFQGKYKINNLDGTANFPENGVQKAVNTVQVLFDPAKEINLNPLLKPKVEEIRSLVRDGYIPNVRMILCNNGAKWTEQAQRWIDQSGLPEKQTLWIHFNHNSIVEILRKAKTVDDTLRMVGDAVFENFNFRRVVIGKVQVSEIAELFNRHHDQLLQRNIRRYLGLNENRVNVDIHRTLVNPESRENFYFFNNGITIICKSFRHNALQGANFQLKLENMQVINGGQTCKTIQQTLNSPDLFADYQNTYVMVRIYELADDDQGFVTDITYATNSQNPVDLRDLRSNDAFQKNLELGMKDLGFTYKRQREEGGAGSSVITSSIVAEATLAVWREKPHQAKFRRREHFGKLYDDIFRELNAAQAILAVLIFRDVENERKRPSAETPPPFMPYASHYVSMLVGRELLHDQGIALKDVSHRNFAELRQRLQNNETNYHARAVEEVTVALRECYGDREISLQQLSATFRRGDLLEMLGSHE
ncbi:AIPR family protein [Desulfobulbus alkaliphilus]|uniref:AIPR family protein n=1 Tax=Desulfobulbus alkaliphilus TaxID=869814 RepID=UPI001962C28B|nr:AIPR family protein [Desulfobulbus alkaliphilus]MBM9538650.1 AIPR family protein [Desulfobulbus alkaliphilus]